MSGCIVLVPVLITAWPMLVSAVASAAVASGFHVVKTNPTTRKTEKIELTLENIDVVAESMSSDEQIVIERKDVRLTFSRDARGHFKTCVDGHLSKNQLEEIGNDIAGRVVQQYVHRRLAAELQNQGFVTLDEEQGADETIRLHVRRYEE